MPVAPIQPAVLAAQQAALYQKALAAHPPGVNVGAVTTLHDEGWVQYRGRRYRTRPVPWRTGYRLQHLRFELDQLGILSSPDPDVIHESLAHAVRVLEEVVALLWTLVIPRWWQRHRWARNPFREAEAPEIRALLNFFSSTPLRYPVGARASAGAPDWCQPMALMPLGSLLVGIHAGWRTMATRAAIAISRSASAASPAKPSAPSGSGSQ